MTVKFSLDEKNNRFDAIFSCIKFQSYSETYDRPVLAQIDYLVFARDFWRQRECDKYTKAYNIS